MRSKDIGTSILVFALLASNFVFANAATGKETQVLASNITQKEDSKISSTSYVVSQGFDEFVRINPYVIHQYKLTGTHGRLLGLARRYMTHTEMKQAITELLGSKR
jgi:hypothetical protein